MLVITLAVSYAPLYPQSIYLTLNVTEWSSLSFSEMLSQVLDEMFNLIFRHLVFPTKFKIVIFVTLPLTDSFSSVLLL